MFFRRDKTQKYAVLAGSQYHSGILALDRSGERRQSNGPKLQLLEALTEWTSGHELVNSMLPEHLETLAKAETATWEMRCCLKEILKSWKLQRAKAIRSDFESSNSPAFKLSSSCSLASVKIEVNVQQACMLQGPCTFLTTWIQCLTLCITCDAPPKPTNCSSLPELLVAERL